ncbi:ribonuclease H-like superfamily protein [Striga asiatica]|uniref:Ribonuclease H-like superfamily protein n=1 Tax=Striga asiatica TaxID=4170 RepID=A0A5A7PUA6_STRAF|nr:ribonuclease H-like superfamily protein [Striga asiatica]
MREAVEPVVPSTCSIHCRTLPENGIEFVIVNCRFNQIRRGDAPVRMIFVKGTNNYIVSWKGSQARSYIQIWEGFQLLPCHCIRKVVVELSWWRWRKNERDGGQWLPSTPTGIPTLKPNIVTDVVYVWELMEDGGLRWNISLLKELFFEEDYKAILQISSINSTRSDQWSWDRNAKGEFRVAKAYSKFVEGKFRALDIAEGSGQEIKSRKTRLRTEPLFFHCKKTKQVWKLAHVSWDFSTETTTSFRMWWENLMINNGEMEGV